MTEPAQYVAAMHRALALAANGPARGVNPQVGCVLIDRNGTTVAEGWHRGAGTAHAEVDALSKLAGTRTGTETGTRTEAATRTEAGGEAATRTEAGGEAPSSGQPARGLTAVVTLEPCNHTGRTGPCSEALIAAGVDRVVYAIADPGAASGGAQRLRDAGVTTVEGVLADEASEFLHQWLVAATKKRPYVTVKWASTLDGRAAAADGSSRWITGAASRQHVHQQRAKSDAIIVGTGTVFADNPSLTARGDGGELLADQPVPVVMGERVVPDDSNLRTHPAGLIETGSRDIPGILDHLYDREFRCVFVEGGPTLASAFIEAGLVDEYLVYLAPKLVGGPKTAIGDIGVAAIGGAKNLRIISVQRLGDDVLITARPKEGI